MTIEELYNQTLGPAGPENVAAWTNENDMWKMDPGSNPSLKQANDDYRELAYNEQVQQLADALLKKNQANRSMRQAQLLKGLLAQPNVNLFSAPRNPTEAIAQQIVQEHINAGVRGLSAQSAGAALQKKNQQEALDRALKLRQVQLENRNQAMKEAQFPLQQQQLRQNITLAGKNRQDIETNNAQLRIEANQRLRDAAQARDYKNALDLVGSGVSPSKLLSNFPNLTPEDFQNLNAAAEAVNTQNHDKFATINSRAQQFNDEMQKAAADAVKAYQDANQPGRIKSALSYIGGLGQKYGSDIPGESSIMDYLSGVGQADPAEVEKARQAAQDTFLKAFQKDKGSAGFRFDPSSGQIVPVDVMPSDLTPIDTQLLRRRPQPGFGGGPGPALPQLRGLPPDGIPIVRSPDELQLYSDYRNVRGPDGTLKSNPYYRPAARVPAPAPVVSSPLSYYGTPDYGGGAVDYGSPPPIDYGNFGAADTGGYVVGYSGNDFGLIPEDQQDLQNVA